MVLDNVEMSIVEKIKNFDKSKVNEITVSALKEGYDPLVILNWTNKALTEVGKDYSEEKIFLPELVAAADTVQSIMPLLLEKIMKEKKEVKSKGVVALGTVHGDVHTIGKTMVATLLRASGFEVIDLGINIPAEVFVKSVQKEKIDILAMSALLTTTAPEQKKVIKILKEKSLRDKVKIMVGSGAITKEFALEIEADGYEPTAPGAVRLAEKFMEQIKK